MSVDGTNNVIDVSTAGYYLIFGACEVQSLADGDQVRLRVLDGTTRIGRMDQVVGAAASVVLQVHCVASLASGASIAVEVLTATGSTNTGTEQSHFTMVRVN